MRPERPCVDWFHESMPSSIASSWCTTNTGASATVFERRVGDDQRHLDDAVGVGLEAGHFHVDPDQAVGVLGHGCVRRLGVKCSSLRRSISHTRLIACTPHPSPRIAVRSLALRCRVSHRATRALARARGRCATSPPIATRVPRALRRRASRSPRIRRPPTTRSRKHAPRHRSNRVLDAGRAARAHARRRAARRLCTRRRRAAAAARCGTTSLLLVGVALVSGVVALPLSLVPHVRHRGALRLQPHDARRCGSPTSPRHALLGAVLGLPLLLARAVADGARRGAVVALRVARVGRASSC